MTTTLPLEDIESFLKLYFFGKHDKFQNIVILISKFHAKSITNSFQGAESFFKNPTVVQLVKNCPSFHGIRRFITVYSRASRWSTFSVKSIQSTLSYLIISRSIPPLSSHLCLFLPNDLFPSGFPNKICYAVLLSLGVIFCAHLIILCSINLIIFGNEYKSWSTHYIVFLRHLIIFPFLCPNTLLLAYVPALKQETKYDITKHTGKVICL
jgi:hypothetical protein